jgi:hypothetical protein
MEKLVQGHVYPTSALEIGLHLRQQGDQRSVRILLSRPKSSKEIYLFSLVTCRNWSKGWPLYFLTREEWLRRQQDANRSAAPQTPTFGEFIFYLSKLEAK